MKRTNFLSVLTDALAAAVMPFKVLAKPTTSLGPLAWREVVGHGVVGSQGFAVPTPEMLNAMYWHFATQMDDRGLPLYIQPEEIVCRNRQTAAWCVEILGSKYGPPGHYDEETDAWVYGGEEEPNVLHSPLRIIMRPELFDEPGSEEHAWFLRAWLDDMREYRVFPNPELIEQMRERSRALMAQYRPRDGVYLVTTPTGSEGA